MKEATIESERERLEGFKPGERCYKCRPFRNFNRGPLLLRCSASVSGEAELWTG